MQLRVNGDLVTTTATEFRLLDYLARHPGRVFSRDHLLDAVWGDARFVTPRSVDVYVRRIREKIESRCRIAALFEDHARRRLPLRDPQDAPSPFPLRRRQTVAPFLLHPHSPARLSSRRALAAGYSFG